MRKTIYGLISVTMVLIAVTIFAGDASAQRTRRETRGRMMNKAQVRAVITRVENRVDNFVSNYDKALDRSRLDGSSRENWLMSRARDLERATDELSREFDRRDTWAENKAEVRSCLNIATEIDRNMRNYKFGATAEGNWNRVRYELNTLADIYNLPKVGAAAY